jgi:hypothetical protein
MTAGRDSHSELSRIGRSSASGRVISESLELKFAVVIGNCASSRDFSLQYGANAMRPVFCGTDFSLAFSVQWKL